jgi:hypothetical protein
MLVEGVARIGLANASRLERRDYALIAKDLLPHHCDHLVWRNGD